MYTCACTEHLPASFSDSMQFGNDTNNWFNHLNPLTCLMYSGCHVIAFNKNDNYMYMYCIAHC